MISIPPLRHWFIVSAVLLIGAGILGILVSVSGIVPIKASSGHWPMTHWFLQFSKERSVNTHSLGRESPSLAEGSVLTGARHYETGCRPCHGAPGEPMPRIGQAMTPQPPDLAGSVAKWKANELHYIVQHGIKFTGMPAWPNQNRPDEVWAMVAFLQKLPTMTPADYEALARGPFNEEAQGPPMEDLSKNISPIIGENCNRCHGPGGTGLETAGFPKLAGQRAAYLHKTLQAYAGGDRYSGIMEPVAATLTDEQIEVVSRYYSELPPEDDPPGDELQAKLQANSDIIALGKEIAHKGIPSRKVPSCADCHGPEPSRPHDEYPVLAGQHADYLILQLELFQEERRGGALHKHLMLHVAPGLSPEDIRAVAHYYASLRSEKP